MAEALLNIFARLGFPKEMVTDLGTTFMAKVMQELLKVCGIKHVTTTCYHPQANGLNERFNGTLNHMLKTYAHKHPNDCDQRLQHLLFGYREVPQESTGFSPFELLYGRQARGPLDILKEAWSGAESVQEQDIISYLQKLQDHLQQIRKIAADNMSQAQQRQKA